MITDPLKTFTVSLQKGKGLCQVQLYSGYHYLEFVKTWKCQGILHKSGKIQGKGIRSGKVMGICVDKDI